MRCWMRRRKISSEMYRRVLLFATRDVQNTSRTSPFDYIRYRLQYSIRYSPLGLSTRQAVASSCRASQAYFSGSSGSSTARVSFGLPGRCVGVGRNLN